MLKPKVIEEQKAMDKVLNARGLRVRCSDCSNEQGVLFPSAQEAAEYKGTAINMKCRCGKVSRTTLF